MDEQPAFYTGRLLLALPGMEDPRFAKAVILMAAHDEDGALGIAIGAPVPGLGLRELLGSLDMPAGDAPDDPVLLGGPVDTERGFVLHSDDWGGRDSVQIANLCTLTATTDILRAIGEGGGPSRHIVALGYAGWGPGQLEGEMTRHGWFLADASRAILFDTPPAERWSAAYRAAGIDPALLASGSGAA